MTVDLHHVETGQGTSLLLGASLGATLEMWDPQLPLAAHHRLIRFDTRGHGGSPVPAGPYTIAELGADVLALMDRLGVERADYAGVSIGGMVGQWLAVNAPDRIARLIVICSAPRTTNSDTFIERAATVRAQRSVEPVAEAVVARWFTERFAAAQPEVIDRHRAMVAATPPDGYASCAEAVAGHDVRAGLPLVTAPTLVIAGAQDNAIGPDNGRAIAEAIPGARFELLDPGAHLATIERADDINRLIEEHLR
jgi:3-oxoadipate enol-lactonase